MLLADALDAESGVVCVVGAGGKKTTLYTLANALDRTAVTATVRIPIFDEAVTAVHATESPAAALAGTTTWPVGVVAERERQDRYAGYDPAVVDRLAGRIRPHASPDEALADVLLVKADGARTRWLKAPDDREPQLPREADVVIPIASARVVGEPLSDERVHRPERVAALTGLSPGDRISATDVATVLASRDGGLKDVPPDAAVVPLVNMVDDDDLERTGRAVAEAVLDRAGDRIERVVLARMIDPDPLVDVVD